MNDEINAQSSMLSEIPPDYRCGYVAITGRPNVGKSTLLNRLLGERLVAVSPKAQTTRHKILGILSGERYQVLFLDTPGIMYKPSDELDRRMLRRVDEAVEDADVVLLLVEPHLPRDSDKELIDQIRQKNKTTILAINKIDTVGQDQVESLKLAYGDLYPFSAIAPISALTGEGVEQLVETLVSYLPERPPFYPPDQLTDRPERFVVAELIREQIYYLYGDEIPYDTAVEIAEFHEAEPEKGRFKDYIKAIIYVNRDSQKQILIGSGGQAIKQLGQQARQAIEMFLERPVYLELWVKVRKKWRKNPGFLRHIGY